MKVPIIYVLGHGRSGSTLLDLLLAEAGGGTSIGQMIGYCDGASLSGRLCSCGERASDCPLWGTLRDPASSSHSEVQSAVVNALFDRRRPKEILTALAPQLSINSDSSHEHSHTLRQILAISEGEFLVDSSKSATRHRALAQMDGMELTTVFLVRDVIGVVRSKANPKSAKPRSILISALSWSLQNIVSAIYFRKVMTPKTCVTFQELTSGPLDVVNQVLAKTNVSRVQITSLPIKSSQHMLLGNSIKNDRSIAIRPPAAAVKLTRLESIVDAIVSRPSTALIKLICPELKGRI